MNIHGLLDMNNNKIIVTVLCAGRYSCRQLGRLADQAFYCLDVVRSFGDGQISATTQSTNNDVIPGD